MLATTLGIPFDADKAWDEREQQYKMSGEIVKTRPFVQTAEGDKSGLWTSVISAVVFILDVTHVEKPTNGGSAHAHNSTHSSSGSSAPAPVVAVSAAAK
jgi:hypothetical protein